MKGNTGQLFLMRYQHMKFQGPTMQDSKDAGDIRTLVKSV